MMSEEQTTVAVQRYLDELAGTRLPSQSSGRFWIGRPVDSTCFAQPSVPGLPTIDATTGEPAARRAPERRG